MSEKIKKFINVSHTVIFIIALVIFMIAFSIGLPIYCRFFYYIQIKTLHLREVAADFYLDVTDREIRQAYDEVLNFCTLPNRPFGTGVLEWTESEKQHFTDCKVLFNINFWCIIIGGLISLTLVLLNRFKVITLLKPLGHKSYFWAAIIAIALPVIILLLVVIVGFDRAFQVFHKIFFPGKDDWIFDWETEQIIVVMPQEFFMNCAIIIAVGLITFAGTLITLDLLLGKKEKKRGLQDTADLNE